MVINWLTRIYNQGSLKIEAHNARVRDVLKEFRVKLEYYLYETYAHIIIDQFFTVIIGILEVNATLDTISHNFRSPLNMKRFQSFYNLYRFSRLKTGN